MSIIEQAAGVIKRYTQRKTMETIERAEEEKHGKGCGCPTCAKFWVREVNEWINFSVPEDSPFKGHDIYTTEIEKGKTVVRGGFSDVSKEKMDAVQKKLKDGTQD